MGPLSHPSCFLSLWEMPPCRVVKPAQLVLQIFPCSCRSWGLGTTFPSSRFYQGRGLSLALDNLRWTVPSPLPSLHTTACTLHSAQLHWGQEITLLCTFLIDLPSFTKWEQIVPTILFPCWQGSCTCGVPAQHASAPLLKNFLWVFSLQHWITGFSYMPFLKKVKSLS